MFDRDDYYSVDQMMDEDLLNYNQVDIIRTALEDIIDRVYNPTMIDEEVDLQIRKIAAELAVYVPKFETEDLYFDRVESLLSSFVHPMDKYFYYVWNTEGCAIYHFCKDENLVLVKQAGLNEYDIEKFCKSHKFTERVGEAKCALRNA